MRREPVVFLQHIRLCLDRIDTFTIEGEAAFYADAKTQDAVIRNLEWSSGICRPCAQQ